MDTLSHRLNATKASRTEYKLFDLMCNINTASSIKEPSIAQVTSLQCISSSGALDLPEEPNIIRRNASLHPNGYAIMSAAVMYFGGAKTGKTRLLIEAFRGCDYIFLDFDRNYKSTIDEIIKSGAKYFNGDNAYNVLGQLMDGEGENTIVVIDSFGAVIKAMCRRFIDSHTTISNDGTKSMDREAEAIKEAMKGIGINGEDTRTFFNYIIEPMTRNNNSINFIHHTTQNMVGEKMEGNQGAWLSLFDFTYQMDRNTRTFKLMADRLPIAPSTVGADNVYDRINKIIKNNAEVIAIDGQQQAATRYKHIHNNKTARLIINDMLKDGTVKKMKAGKIEYLNAELIITDRGQCRVDNGVITPLYEPQMNDEIIAEVIDVEILPIEHKKTV